MGKNNVKKYIFVTGGVVSSLGKGIATASIGHLLELYGLNVALQKFDPYINVDAGTMSPYQHGEVYVTRDGAEVDLDLGHYERFTNATITRDNNITTGKIYSAIIKKEREGAFLGHTVQVIPHITNEIKASIMKISQQNVDIVLCEIGGTVGDIESLPYLEAIRQFKKDVGQDNVLYVHLSLIPYIHVSEEAKTKPTQHSVMRLRELGIFPDTIICRTERALDRSLKEKIALFCDVDIEAIINAPDTKYVYEVPLNFKKEGLDEIIIKKLGLQVQEAKADPFDEVVRRLYSATESIKVAVVGKYVHFRDAYKSINEALLHGACANHLNVNIQWTDAELLNDDSVEKYLSGVDGILIPGGFGYRGIEGKLAACKFARKNNIPFFGICLGLQCAVIDFANDVVGLVGAHSSEFVPDTPHAVIDLLENQRDKNGFGGTMRLGVYPTNLHHNTLAQKIYSRDTIYERHRHRYEINPKYYRYLQKNGLCFSGISTEPHSVEIIELQDHPWFLAVQFHPEFESKPTKPSPLFVDFLRACKEYKSEIGR